MGDQLKDFQPVSILDESSIIFCTFCFKATDSLSVHHPYKLSDDLRCSIGEISKDLDFWPPNWECVKCVDYKFNTCHFVGCNKRACSEKGGDIVRHISCVHLEKNGESSKDMATGTVGKVPKHVEREYTLRGKGIRLTKTSEDPIIADKSEHLATMAVRSEDLATYTTNSEGVATHGKKSECLETGAESSDPLKLEAISPKNEEIVAEQVASQRCNQTNEIKKTTNKGCDVCGDKVTTVKQEVEDSKHDLTSLKIELTPCDEMKKEVPKDRSGVRVRIRAHFTCGICKFICSELFAIKKHYKEHHESDLVYICEPCYFVSHNKYTYWTHFKVTHADDSLVPDSPINLDDIDFSESPQDERVVHTIRKYNCYLKSKCSPSIKCKFCTFRTAYDQSLKDHIFSRHYTSVSETLVNIADDSRTYRCIFCGEISETKRAVSSHYVQAHVRLPSLSCELCESDIRDKSQLLLHMKTGKHREYYRRSLKCPYCQFATLSKKSLRQHTTATHKISDKPAGHLACDKCSHVALSKNNLNMHKAKVHMIVKGEDGLYQCNECDYKTNNKDKLMYHAKSAPDHAATKTSVRCDICDFVARNRSGMMYHKNSAHGKNEDNQDS